MHTADFIFNSSPPLRIYTYKHRFVVKHFFVHGAHQWWMFSSGNMFNRARPSFFGQEASYISQKRRVGTRRQRSLRRSNLCLNYLFSKFELSDRECYANKCQLCNELENVYHQIRDFYQFIFLCVIYIDGLKWGRIKYKICSACMHAPPIQ